MSHEGCLAGLADSTKPVLSLGLEQFSDSSPDEVRDFQESFGKLERQRRRDIIDELIFLARSNSRLNYDDIFFSCLADTDARVRACSIEGLWECDDYIIIPSLMEILTGDGDNIVRVAAANKLGRLAVRAATKEVHSRYIKMIGDALLGIVDMEGEKVELRCEAMEALASLAFPGAEGIINKAHKSDNLEMRICALKSMGLNCNRKWLSVLLKELNNPEPSIRLEAVKACGELGEDDVIPYLIRLIDGSNPQEQLAALGALKQLGGDEVKQALSMLLDHPDEQVRSLVQEICEEEEFEMGDNIFLDEN